MFTHSIEMKLDCFLNQLKGFTFRLSNSSAAGEVRHVSTEALLAFLQNNDEINLRPL